MNLVERLARALWVECGCQRYSEFDNPTHASGTERFRQLARCAVEAMRTPTQHMLDEICNDEPADYTYKDENIRRIWEGMCNAALMEEKSDAPLTSL